jgi:transposase
LVKVTHVQGGPGVVEVGATRLLGIEGLTVVRVELDAEGGRVVHAKTSEGFPPGCPKCGVISTSFKGSVVTHPRDVPYGSARVRLVWHKSRWRCRERLCPRGSFTESITAVPARARVTARLRQEVGEAAADRFSCVLAAAGHYRVSWPIANTALMAHIGGPLAKPLPAVAVLGIDETRRGKPVWEQDPETGKWRVAHDRWHTGIVDAVGSSGLLAHVEGRTSQAVVDWLEEQPQPWRAAVTHVCMDLSASYAKAVRTALPAAVIVADRFHLVSLANDMLTEVRQRVTREHYGRRGRKSDPAWTSRRRLLTGYPRLSPEGFVRMWNGLIDTGDPGIEILHAYTVKEDLRALLALAGTNPARCQIAARLERFYLRAASCPAPEAHRLAETIEAWWPAIEAGLVTGYSNARSEGYNRLAKHVGRDAFGFRNVDNQRQRIRWTCTRQHRRESATRTELPAQV